MIPDNVPGTTGPALSNYLTVQAAEVAGEVARYKRASAEAHEAYMRAAYRLVSVRGSCRRGEWRPFVEAAGISARTAQDMMALARAGVTAEDVTAAGGVRGALEAIRAAAAVAVEVAADSLGDGEKSATVAGFSAPTDGPEPPAGNAPGHFSDREVDPPAGRRALTLREAAEAPAKRRQARREAGRCAECGAPSGDAYRCPPCAAKHRQSSNRTTGYAKLGRELAGRIGAAARKGAGVRLTAAEVARLVQGRGSRGDGT